MKKQKSLGQIAYEADYDKPGIWITWEHLSSVTQELYEKLAAAVAEECARESEDAISNGVVTLSAREVGDFIRSRPRTEKEKK